MGSLAKWNQPTSLTEAQELAKIVTSSGMCPKNFIGKPKDAFVAMAYGAELGLSPIASLQNVAVINGKPSMYGDMLMALVRAHPDCIDINEKIENGVASCTVHRKGCQPETRTFSVDDAKKAGLWGRKGPWSDYPNRMLQMRARSWALRDVFADALAGFIAREEAEDYHEVVKPAEVVEPDPELKQIAEANKTKAQFIEAQLDAELRDACRDYLICCRGTDNPTDEQITECLNTWASKSHGESDYMRVEAGAVAAFIKNLRNQAQESDQIGCNTEETVA